MPLSRPRRILRALIISLGLIAAGPAAADTVQLKPDRPDRYTVVEGDTLWDIAARFLQSPWHWPRVWTINPGIRNPHLIYPGDVIVLRYVDGQPELALLRSRKLTPGARANAPAGADARVVRLTPRVHSEPLDQAIPTISPEVILPFLGQPLVVGERELEQAGYITIGLDSRIALGDQSEFYARGIGRSESRYYHIFRPGDVLRDPRTGEVLAYEAVYLGSARLLEGGDPAKLVVTEVKQEILPTDRLLAAPERPPLPYYFPHAPKRPIDGYVIGAENAVAEIGSYTAVAVSVGRRDGLEDGHVLRVLYRQGQHTDPVTRDHYALPNEESALLLVFRTFEKVSYALVLHATRPVNLLDLVTTP